MASLTPTVTTYTFNTAAFRSAFTRQFEATSFESRPLTQVTGGWVRVNKAVEPILQGLEGVRDLTEEEVSKEVTLILNRLQEQDRNAQVASQGSRDITQLANSYISFADRAKVLNLVLDLSFKQEQELQQAAPALEEGATTPPARSASPTRLAPSNDNDSTPPLAAGTVMLQESPRITIESDKDGEPLLDLEDVQACFGDHFEGHITKNMIDFMFGLTDTLED